MAVAAGVTRDKRYHMPAEELYMVGREWHFEWFKADIERAVKLWDGGYSLRTIAARLDCDCWSALMLLHDLAENNRIKARPGFIWGSI